MRVLLINPPAENEILSCNPEIIKEERGFDPPLGLLYLAGYLKKYSDYEVKILDCQVERLNYKELKEEIKKFDPDIIGITAMTLTLIDVMKTIRVTKEVCPDTRVVLGGPHAHIYPEETVRLKDIDFVVLGEGEETFFHLLKNINNIEALKQIAGLVFKDKEGIINTGPRPFYGSLDEIPFPPREMLPYKKYFSLLAKKTPITTMFTSRGCPYKCLFCDRPQLGKNFRGRSAKNVVDEMEICEKMGIKEIFIYDDTFGVDRQRVLDICKEYQKRGLTVIWDIRTRVNTVDEEVLKALKKSNCQRIHYGVEAGTEKILKVLRKGITLEMAENAFKLTKKLGIQTFAYFMIGSPTETKEDILETIRIMKKLDPDFVQITITTPFPATDLYRMALAQGVIKYDYWKEFAQNPQPGFKTRYWTKELSENELEELLAYAYKQFYLRPPYILKRVLKIRSLPELLRKVKAGINVIKMKKNAI